MLSFVSGNWHLSDVCNLVLVVDIVVQEITLVLSVESLKQFGTFPNCVCSQQEVLAVVAPLNIADTEVVVFGHLQRALTLLDILRSCACLEILVDVIM